MAKEGYSNKGWANYHGEPLDSATASKGKKVSQEAAPFKGGCTSYQGMPEASLVKGKTGKGKK